MKAGTVHDVARGILSQHGWGEHSQRSFRYCSPMPLPSELQTQKTGAPTVITDLFDRGGFFHCTSVRALRLILRAGYLHPANLTGAPARGAAVASRVRRLGGVSLFALLPKTGIAASDATTNLVRPWLWKWLAFYQPVTVASHIDRTRFLNMGGRVLSELETRPLAAGLMLRGEVCHVGSLSLSGVDGYLFVRRSSDTGFIGRYLHGSSPSNTAVRNVLAHLRRASKFDRSG